MQVGQTVADRFEIEREAGAGGMGTVYLARDRIDGGRVALKVLAGRSEIDEARFGREAVTLAAIDLPGVVRYVAHGRTASGHPWMAMEWLDGETLSARIAREPLSLAESLALIRHAAEALSGAHAAGVVHRDLKPSNLFLLDGRHDRVKLIDFGIARARGVSHTLTRTGQVMGTPVYMAPEQARGLRSVDPRTDVYALGCVLFELVTGRPPFAGPTMMAVLAKVLIDAAPLLSELRPDAPADVEALVDRMLDKDPDARPADAAAVVAALDALGELERATALSTPSAPPEVLTADEQRVLCVVMTAGMAHRATSAPTLPALPDADPERRARALAAEHGGALELLADGSTVTTLVGTGTPTDRAARAALFALALRRVLATPPMVVVAGRGRMSARLPVGELIDRGAELLEDIADSEPDGAPPVRIDPVMASLLDGRFEIGGDAFGLYLRGAREVREGGRTLLGRAIPCVGRDRELANIEAILEECADEPVARAVLVTAPPGGGKSRVCHELLARLRVRGDPVEILFARGDPMSAGSSFSLLGEVVRRAAGVGDGEPLDVRRHKLEARLSRHLSGADLARVKVFLGELARVPFADEAHPALRAARGDAALMGDSMRAAFEDWLAAECAAQPVLLVFEDLHWGDSPTVRFVDGALRHLSDRPLCVVAFGRPEVDDQFPELWSERDLQTVRLARLTKRASREIVQAALGDDVDPQTMARIVDRADGNAFYLEELVRAVSAGVAADLPESVLGMVQARLDLVSADARRVLRAASVYGQTFWRGGVARMVGGDVPVDSLLGELERQEIVASRATTAFPGELEYELRHALVQETAYAMLTDHDRQLAHRLAGEWLESVAPDHDPLLLAEHYRRGGLDERASHWYGRAAAQALEANDYAAALERAEMGVDTKAVTGFGALRLVQAEAHRWRGEYQSAAARGREAAEAVAPGSAEWFQAAGNVLVAAGQLGDAAEVDLWVDRVRQVIPEPDTRGAQLVCLCRAVYQYLGAGRYDVADAILLEMRGKSDGGDPVSSAWVHTTRASRALHAGDLGAYLSGTRHAVEAYELAGDLRHACNQRVRLGYGYVEVGDFGAAEEVLRSALAAARRMGVKVIQGYALQNLGYALAQMGRHDEAHAQLVDALGLGQELANPRLEGGSRLYLAAVAIHAGEPAAAEREARAAIGVLEGARPLRTVGLAHLTRSLLARGETAAALAVAVEAVGELEALAGMEEGEALVRLAHAEARVAAGDVDAARSAIAVARRHLLERAAKISDRGWRASFLERVPEHARTMELAAELGVSPADP